MSSIASLSRVWINGQTAMPHVAMLLRNALIACFIAVGVTLLTKWVLRRIDNWLLAHFTAVNDLKNAGLPRQGLKLKGKAVVAGGSIAGLLQARILSDHFEQVTVIESEDLSIPDAPRTHVAQYFQAHVLLAFTFYTCRNLFPNFDKEVEALGGRISQGERYNFLFKETFLNFTPAFQIPIVVLSRPFFEPLLRKLVKRDCPSIQFATGTVTSIRCDASKTRVESITKRYKTESGGYAEEVIPVALLVDATGPSLCSLKWLKQVGLSQPLKNSYEQKVAYSCTVLPVNRRIKEETAWPNNGSFDCGPVIYAGACDLEKGKPWGVFLQRGEENTILIGVSTRYPELERPTNLDELVECMATDSLMKPIAHQLGEELRAESERRRQDIKIVSCPPIECYSFEFKTQDRQLSNLVLIGDSRIRVNPIYGQGMSKASIDVVTLDGLLRQQTSSSLTPGFASSFHKAVLPRTKGVYLSTKNEDYYFDSTVPTEGESLAQGQFMRTFIDFLVKAAERNPKVTDVFFSVQHFLRPPTDLLSPLVLFNVLKEMIVRKNMHL